MFRVTLYDNIEDTKGIVIHYANQSDIKLTSGVVAEGINVVDSFLFEMNMNNPGYLRIQSLVSLVTVYNTKTNKMIFDGYVLNQNGTYEEDGIYHKSVLCVSALNYLKLSKQEFGEFHNKTTKEFLQILIDVHNPQVEPHRRFKLGIVDVTNSTDNVYRYTNQEATTFDTIFDKLVDRIGGELRVRHVDGQWYLDWMKTIGEVKETQIRVGTHIKTASRSEDTDAVFTRWMVYGAEIESDNPDDTGAARARITIADVNGGKDYIDDIVGIAQFGIQVGHITFDDVNDKNILLKKGKAYVTAYNQVSISNTVMALDLSLIGLEIDSYEVYNWYPLNNPGLADKDNVRIIEKRTDINIPQNSNLLLGTKQLTASQYQVSTKKDQKAVEELKKTVANQSRSIAKLNSLNVEMNDKYNAVQKSYNDLSIALELDDATGTSVALGNLKNSIDELVESYVPVTTTDPGFMIPDDKIKLDNLQVYSEATHLSDGLLSSSDKTKLDLIDVDTEIDLNDLVARIIELESK